MAVRHGGCRGGEVATSCSHARWRSLRLKRRRARAAIRRAAISDMEDPPKQSQARRSAPRKASTAGLSTPRRVVDRRTSIPRSTTGDFRSSGRSDERVIVAPIFMRTATTCSPRCCSIGGRATPQWTEIADGAASATTAGRRASRSRSSGATSTRVEGWIDRFGDLAARDSRRSSAPARTCRASCSKAPRSSSGTRGGMRRRGAARRSAAERCSGRDARRHRRCRRIGAS